MGFIIGKTCPDNIKMNNCCTYFVLGTVTIFQYGAGQNGVMRTLGKYMLGSGATFGYVAVHSALL